MTNLPCPKALATRESFNLQLERQAIYVLPDAAQARLVCTGGALWVTLDGQPEDIVLKRCEEFTTPLHTRAVVYALKPSGLFVAPHSGDAVRPRPRQSALQKIGHTVRAAMGHSMQRYLDRCLAHSPIQASAANVIWY
jgi:hypothetical protein